MAYINIMINKIAQKVKYPKFLLLLLIYIITIAFFYMKKALLFHSFLLSSGYVGIFLGGIFYAYGFTAAPATAVLLVLAKQQNYILAGIVGGIGALLSDTVIFLFIRRSFIDEVEKFKKEKIIILIGVIITKIFNSFSKYFLLIIACLFIASPLPTEIGVILMASIKSVSLKKFLLIAYLLHTFGIFIILLIGSSM